VAGLFGVVVELAGYTREGVVAKPYGQGLTLAGWSLAVIGVLVVLTSVLAPDRLTVPLLAGGSAVFALGLVAYVVCQFRR
jgi:hypothetical protein